jgi:hypothetical protein
MGNRAYQDLLDLVEAQQGTSGCNKIHKAMHTLPNAVNFQPELGTSPPKLAIYKFCAAEAQAPLQEAFGSKQSTGTGSKKFSKQLSASTCDEPSFGLFYAGPGQKAVRPRRL